jgi:two-component system chemotaxis response regulator CheY
MFDLKTRVLVAEDMVGIRKMVTGALRQIGFTEITEAADGKLAWEHLNEAFTPTGLIVSDWMMPNMSGLDLLKKVRADERFATIPFLMLTAEAQQAQIIEAIKAGVSSYVVKPFAFETLQSRLEAMHQAIEKKK